MLLFMNTLLNCLNLCNVNLQLSDNYFSKISAIVTYFSRVLLFVLASSFSKIFLAKDHLPLLVQLYHKVNVKFLF